MRKLSLIITTAFFALSATANAATIGDALQLTDSIKVATKQRCPKGESGDMASLTAALKCQSIDMVVGSFGLKLAQLAQRLMDECINDLKGGKDIKTCKATNDNYKQVVLTDSDEQAYLNLRARYEALLRDYPVIR